MKLLNIRAIRYFDFCLIFTLALIVTVPVSAERLPVRIYTSADGIGSGFVDNVYRDSRGFIWACTRDGLSRFDGTQFVNYRIGGNNAPPGIENIYESRKGNYFITTTGGTYRFNPSAVPTSETAGSQLNAELVTQWRGRFAEDGNGQLWQFSSSIYRVVEENGTLDFQKADWGIPPAASTFVVFDVDDSPDGSIWVYTSWGIVRRMPDERLMVYTIDRSEYGGGGTSTLTVDNNGRVWVTFHNQFFVINPEPRESFAEAGKVTVRPLKTNSVIGIAPDKNVPLPRESGEIYEFTNPDFISNLTTRRMFQGSDGDIWISTVNYLLRIEKGILRVYSSEEGLPNIPGRMEEDSAGNLWISGYNGLARLDRNGFVTYGKSDGAYSSQFYAVVEDKNGKLYFANTRSHFTAFTGNKLESVRPAITPTATQTWTSRFIFRDSGGDFWLLTTGKLYRFSGVRDFRELNNRPPSKIYGIEEGLKSDIMFQIFEDSGGNIWVSTRGSNADFHGLSRLKKGGENFQTFTERDGFPSKTSPSAFAEDSRGNIWLGFYEGGFARFDGQKFEVLSDRAGFPAKGIISDLHFDAQGRLWLSTSNTGIFRIDDPTAKELVYLPLTTEDGLSSNNVRTLTEDRFGRIYAGTASGVDRISPDTKMIKHYSVNDGLAADFVVDSHCDRDGDLWFVTFDGISRLTPRLDERSAAPPVFIGGLRIAGAKKAVSELGSAEIEIEELSHIQNNIEIEYFALNFRPSDILRYQYKLEGADADWSEPSPQRTRTFANLSPGTYRFMVRSVNSDGAVGEKAAIVAFRILPPIFARRWFIALCAAALGIAVYLVYRYRVANLRAINSALTEAKKAEEELSSSRAERIAELEKVRIRIAADLHDDIGASLTQIAVLSEVAQAQSRGNGAGDSLARISEVSNELVGTMSDIVWSINPAKDHLFDLTQRMRRFASDVLSPKGIVFQLTAPELTDAITINSNVRREVFLIFKESINNIVKHAGASQVAIRIEVESSDLELTIADNGKGFGVEKTFANSFSSIEMGGNGILSMQKRAQAMNGELHIDSQIGKGTTIRLKQPLQAA